MNFTYHEIDRLPVVVIDDFYSKDSIEKMWQELCFLNNDPRKFQEDPKSTGSAYNFNAENERIYFKKACSLFLDEVYQNNRSISNILIENRKLFSIEIRQKLTELHPFFKYMECIDFDNTLFNYYENSDHYLPHIDQAVLTAVTFFYKKPKSFFGGELVIEKELSIDCVYNRCVIFSSILSHEVTEVILDNKSINQNNGRFSITQFLIMRGLPQQ